MINLSDRIKRKHGKKEEDDANVRDKKHRATRPSDGERCRDVVPQETSQEHVEDETSSADVLQINRLKNLAVHITNSDEMIQKLLMPRFGFLGRLQRGTRNVQLTEMLVKVIAIACRATDQTLLLKFLHHTNNSRFIRSDVLSYLNQLMTTSENIECNTEILNAIVQILDCLVSKFPRNSLQVVSLALPSIQYILKTRDIDYLFELNKIEAKLVGARKCVQCSIPTRDDEKEESCLTNVKDFKLLSTSPTCEDIKGNGDQYLRKNKIFQRYENTNDYLDVHFRLLREDLIRPLREGLAELLEIRNEEGHKKSRCVLKVYRNLKFLSYRYTETGVVYRIRFDVSRMGHVRWVASKRLKFGSLVCLSRDQFKTMLIGTIAESNAKDLVNGVTFLSFDNDRNQLSDIQFNCFYEMIESPSYYEPYKSALTVLQNMTDRNLPFQKYLLNHSFDEVSPPKYLTRGSYQYDFTCLLSDGDWLQEPPERRVPILYTQLWPSADRLGLDESQYAALKSALTTELSVIQGPPGTGKTFIGVIIVQLLLANRFPPFDCFHRFPRFKGPIMIVCYTNHALDQFLEGIFERLSIHDYSREVIRVGGRCKSEDVRLQHCNLSSIIHRKREWSDTKQRANALKLRSMRANAFLELAREEILHEQVLKDYMLDSQFESLVRYCRPDDPSVLLDWLDDGRGNYWISTHLRHGRVSEHTPVYEQEFVEFNQWGGRDSEVNHLKSEWDFESFQREVRASSFLNFSSLNSLDDRKLRTLREIRRTFKESKPSYLQDVWLLEHKDRWMLYNYWVQLAVTNMNHESAQAFYEYTQVRLTLENEQMEEKIRVLEKADIIAMTTTGAAKHNEILQRVRPKIVIVEEAAEVLESHVTTSITEGCEHLILIGDHLQLRPKPSDYVLAKRYRLQVSLFERMLLNEMHHVTLTIQHRMRPEISKLLVPHIYKSLQDHQKVREYDDIAGVLGNVFFLNHSFPENSEDDIKSHSNEHEATFLAGFCKYLLNVGHEASSITVLTAYTGQLLLLNKYLNKCVRVAAIDNYQGEENDIILLSLVRSNTKNQAGFLGISNRVCVALSRARKGLYVVGNADLLRDVSPLWRDILETLKDDDRLVDRLPIGCRKHRDEATYVSVADDFAVVPSYGCRLPCDYRLDCGHTCADKCHPFDQKHERYKCRKPCTRVNTSCPEGHMCQDELCFQMCGPCMVLVERTLSRCLHTAEMECCMREGSYMCNKPCRKTCGAHGHACRKRCFEYCGECQEPVQRILELCKHEITIPCYMSNALRAVRCTVNIERTLTACGHIAQIPCGSSLDSHKCVEPCENVCSVGHRCPKRCHENCGNCEVEVLKTLTQCKHEVKLPCFKDLTEIRCEKPCERFCDSKHKCQLKCGEDCGNCHLEVPITFAGCGHLGQRECHQEPKEVVCQLPCDKSLRCGHACQDICGAEQCTVQCKVEIQRQLSCGHSENIFCFENPSQADTSGCKHESIEASCIRDTVVEIVEVETCLDNAVIVPDQTNHQIGCSNVCKAELPCGHHCQKICQDCCKSDNGHGDCEAECGKYHPLCSHKCRRKCGHQSFQSCIDECTVTCRHSSINHPCGDPYVACQKLCLWNCPHHSCDEPCWSPCGRPPCDEHCRGTVTKCGHKCVGLCGEPCPQICPICEGQKLLDIENRLKIKLTSRSKFLLLKPCHHVVECKYMDRWVKRHMKSPPCELHGSKFLSCPVCKERVFHCPRYNRQMKMYEKHLNMSKIRMRDSEDLKKTIAASLDHQIGLNVKLDDANYRLGTFHTCMLTRSLLDSLPCSSQLDACGGYLSRIEMKFQEESVPLEEISTIDILNLYRIYLELLVFRLKSLIRGPKLRTLEECDHKFSKLPCLDTDPERINAIELWKVVETVNEKLNRFSRWEKKDDVDNYVYFLNRSFDLELDASYNSHWFCCTKGHVYSCTDVPSDHNIDKNCPECNPMPSLLLQSLRSHREGQSAENSVNGNIVSGESREEVKTPERTKDPPINLGESKSSRGSPSGDRVPKVRSVAVKLSSSQLVRRENLETDNSRFRLEECEDLRRSSERLERTSRKRRIVEHDDDDDRGRSDWEREDGRKRVRADSHRRPCTETLDFNPSKNYVLYSRDAPLEREDDYGYSYTENSDFNLSELYLQLHSRDQEWGREDGRKRFRADGHRHSYTENPDSNHSEYDVLYSRGQEHSRRERDNRIPRGQARDLHSGYPTNIRSRLHESRDVDHRMSRDQRSNFIRQRNTGRSMIGCHRGEQDFDERRFSRNYDRR